MKSFFDVVLLEKLVEPDNPDGKRIKDKESPPKVEVTLILHDGRKAIMMLL